MTLGRIIPIPNLDGSAPTPAPAMHIQLTIGLNITHIARTLINTIHKDEIAWTEEDVNTLEYLALLIREKIRKNSEPSSVLPSTGVQ